MSTSGVSTYNEYASELIDSAFAMIGVFTPSNIQKNHAYTLLNKMLKHWQTRGVNLWKFENKALTLTADTASYSLDSDTMEIANVIFRRDGNDSIISPYTREEYRGLANKTSSGDPVGYFFDRLLSSNNVYLYYVPENSTSIVVGSDGNDYRCILDHTSVSSNKPITGADYATYWEATGGTGLGSAWASDTDYKSDVIWYDRVKRVEDARYLNNNIDAPAHFLLAATAELAYLLSFSTGTARLDIKSEARELFIEAKGEDFERGDVRVSPIFR